MRLAIQNSLKRKARILVPDSCVLIGVIDQYGILAENEVFVQIKPDSNSKLARELELRLQKTNRIAKTLGKQKQRVVVGPCLVTKNPCTHPGDIRKLVAVDRAELSHLVNVVVFSRKGSRP